MTILQISEPHHLQSIEDQSGLFGCLLHDDCPSKVDLFRDCSTCTGIALVGSSVCSIRRGKYFVELELSQKYGCPVRLFKNEDKAKQWLLKQLQVMAHGKNYSQQRQISSLML